MTEAVNPCDGCPSYEYDGINYRCKCSLKYKGRCNCDEAQHMADRLGIVDSEVWAPCIVQGNDYAEYCREHCPRYGTGTCVYDPETKRNMVKTGGD